MNEFNDVLSHDEGTIDRCRATLYTYHVPEASDPVSTLVVLANKRWYLNENQDFEQADIHKANAALLEDAWAHRRIKDTMGGKFIADQIAYYRGKA